MFIDIPMISPTGAPEERNVCRRWISEMRDVSLLRSEGNLFELVFYKHFDPTGRGAVEL